MVYFNFKAIKYLTTIVVPAPGEVEGELARDAVVSKCQEYCERAEELRQKINDKAGNHPIPKEAVEIQERHLPKAIEILTRARQEDARFNSLDALRLYEQGLQHFDVVLGYEIYSDNFKEALQSRRKGYEERMNVLREKLHMHWMLDDLSTILCDCSIC